MYKQQNKKYYANFKLQQIANISIHFAYSELCYIWGKK